MAQPLKKELDPFDDLEEMTPEDEAELQAELEASLAEAERGEFIDADIVLAELTEETERLVAARR